MYEGKAYKEALRLNGALMLPTPANIKYAHRIAKEIRGRIAHGTLSYGEYFSVSLSGSTGSPLTLGAQLDAWLTTQSRLEHSTLAGYASAVKFWRSAVVNDHPLGDKALRAVVFSDLLLALATRPKLSGKTVNNYVSVLREGLDLAVKDRVLASNPADDIERASYQKETPDPFSMAEVEMIIADIRDHYPEWAYNLVEWRFFTGVRTSEAAGLRWQNVDLVNPHVVIREALVRGVEKKTTKTRVSRAVRLNSRSLAAIQRQRKHSQMAGAHVWLDGRYGTPWTEERAFRRSYWEPTLKRLGVRYRPPNNMRHTFATMMLMAGRTPAWCAKQLGHSIEMFLRTYSKWIDGAQDDREVKGIEDWLVMSNTSPILPPQITKS